MQNEKAAQGGATKKTNGPVHGSETQTLTQKDVGTMPAELTKTGEARSKKLSPEERLRLFKAYDAADAEYQAQQAKVLDFKRKRSAIVKEIYDGSPQSSFRMKDKGDQIWTIMQREDKREGSPSFGERFFFFRKPSEPLEV